MVEAGSVGFKPYGRFGTMILPIFGSGGSLFFWNHRYLFTVARKLLSSRTVVFPLPKPQPKRLSHHKLTREKRINKVFSSVPLYPHRSSLRAKRSNLQRAVLIAGAAA